MPLNVAVVYGGRSGEHEISIRSSRSIVAALDRAKYAVTEIFITKEGKWQPGPIVPEPGANPGIDVVFPVLHGTFGEDGTIQGLLEMAELPYVSPGVLASSVSMDKEVTKRLLKQQGVPVADYYVVTRGRPVPAHSLGFPAFVKPANLGSSVGISKARNETEVKAAIDLAAQYDSKVIVECSVIGNGDAMAAIPCEILPSREFYDYEDKYLLDAAKVELPAKLSRMQRVPLERKETELRLAYELPTGHIPGKG